MSGDPRMYLPAGLLFSAALVCIASVVFAGASLGAVILALIYCIGGAVCVQWSRQSTGTKQENGEKE